MKKKGFTLVELLAVIVILAIIALIAVPIIMNVVESSRKGAATSSAYGYIDGVKIMYAKEMLSGSDFTLEGTFNVDEEGKLDGHDVEVEGTKAKGGYLTYSNGKITEGCLTIGDYKVTIENDTAKETIKGACEGKETEPEEESSPIEWFTFEENDDGTASVTGLSQLWHDLDDDNKYDISIPSKTPNGNIVTIVKSENDGFYYYWEECHDDNCQDYYDGYGLKSVIIPDSVMVIEESTFVGVGLESVDLGNGVQTIGVGAFGGNNLTSITIPNSVTTIGAYAFSYNNLTSVNIPDSVKTIGEWAFRDNNLTSVTIPNSITEIGNDAFSFNNLTSVTIPNSIKEIGEDVFSHNNLTSVIIPDSVTMIGDYAFEYNNLGSVDLGNGVQTIGKDAFYGNNLTSVIIPNSVTTIGTCAFCKYWDSNRTLTKIINKTGKEFDWGNIVNNDGGGYGEYTFETGTVVNSYGNVEVTNGEE